MKRILLPALAVLAAVAFAVPAASAASYKYAFTVRAGGVVVDNPFAKVTSLGRFEINLKAGPTHKVVYYDAFTGLSFHSLSLTTLSYERSAVKINGIGMVNGKRVSFTVIATDHPAYTDAFKIAWNHMAAHGGNLINGNVHVSQIKLQ
jgi:hypothetical protein